MKVTLLFTQTGMDNINFGSQKFRDKNIGVIPPVSLLNVAAILESVGVEVSIIDVDAEALSYPQILERISQFSPDLIGFTISTYNFQEVLTWIKKIKEDTQTPIIIGGPHVSIYPVECMSHKEIDYAIIGEAELPLPEFVKAFQNGKNFDGIQSLAYRVKGELRIDKTLRTVDDINSIPLYARHLIKNERYSNILTRRKNFTAMLSSRGCPYLCTFCDQKNPPYRYRSPESFVSEIKENYEKHNIREFDIYDSTFTANRKRVIEICKLIVEQGLDVGWTIRSRVDSVNEKVIHALKEAGCHTIFYGIESSNPEILKLMEKRIEIDRIRYIVGYTKDAGIDTLGFFMFGYPGETRETVEDSIKFSLELPLDYAQYSILGPMPKTEIYSYYRERGMEDFWAENTLDPDNNKLLELKDVSLSRDEIQEYVDIANRKFYGRPKNIIHKLKNVRSFDNFMRLSSGGISVVKNWIGI